MLDWTWPHASTPTKFPPNRPLKSTEDRLANIQKQWLDRESQANAEALEILTDLTAEAPQNSAYQLAYAQAMRDECRIARLQGDVSRADASLQRAIPILEDLVRRAPETDEYKYQLALTLGSPGPKGPTKQLASFNR